MTAAEVFDLVRRQVGNDWHRTDWPHGVRLARCVLDPPVKKSLCVAWDADVTLECWVVLEEDVDDEPGYSIVYEEEDDAFGLATQIEGGLLLLGFYGDFVTTLECI
jgi:hypothetical protein